MALVLHHTMGCWPRRAGKIPAVGHPVSSGVWQGETVSLSPQAKEKVTAVPGWGPHRSTCVHSWGQDRDRVLLTCSAGAASSAPGAVSGAMLCPLPTPCPWICLQIDPLGSLHVYFQTAFPSRAAACAAPGMRVLDSAPAARNCNPSVLSPVLVKLIYPLCPLGKCNHSSALRGSWDAEQVLGALPGRPLVPCPTGCRSRAV